MPTITAPSPTPTRRTRSASASRWLVAVVLVLTVGTVSLVAHLGCQRLREVAPIGSSDSNGRTVTGHSWSIQPVGFTVRYADGSSTTRLWW